MELLSKEACAQRGRNSKVLFSVSESTMIYNIYDICIYVIYMIYVVAGSGIKWRALRDQVLPLLVGVPFLNIEDDLKYWNQMYFLF